MEDRLEALRHLLKEGSLSTQDELRMKLEKQNFTVTQSTISRDLRKLNAVRATDSQGQVVYRLPDANAPDNSETSMVVSINPASSLVVIQTSPGSASVVARLLDRKKPAGLMGTIAGDDTVFLAFAAGEVPASTIGNIKALLKELD